MKNIIRSFIFFSLLFRFIKANEFISENPKVTYNFAGNAAGDSFGWSVNSAGDINNDGYDDIIIGASDRNLTRGAVYVIYGGENSTLASIDLSLVALNPMTTGFMIIGAASGDNFGNSVSSAGDIDNDGYDDIIIGAYCKDNYKGAVYVIYGGEKSKMMNIDLSTMTLNPLTTGFMILGNAVLDFLGNSVSSAGDINNDGYADIIIGAMGESNWKGAAYVIYGGVKSSMSDIDLSTTTLNPLTTGFMMKEGAANDYFGSSVSTAGDLNKDGYADIIIGANCKDNFKGAVYVIYGGEKSGMKNIDFSNFTLDPATTGFTIKGNADGDFLGGSLSSAGDINNDGYADILIGAIGLEHYKGAAYVIYGGEKSKMSNIDLSTTTLSPLTTGFTMKGAAVTSQFGYSVSSAGDINKDGIKDIVIGALGGNAYVVYGRKTGFSDIDLSSSASYPATTGFMIRGPSDFQRFPQSLASLDINNDGFPDLLIGAPAANSNRGSVYLMIYTSCPVGCAQCTSDSVCLTCPDGFILSDSKSCINPQQVEEKKGEKASTGAFEGTSLVGAFLNSGSSLPLNFGMVAKILRNVKYINITVSSELNRTFYSWKVASGFMAAPRSWSLKSESKNLPEVFSRYRLNPVFLINFWNPFVLSFIGLAIFMIFKSVEIVLTKKNRQKNILFSISKYVNIAASNFALTQFYSNLDDALLYFIIEVRYTKFDTGFRVFSTILAVILLMTGGIFIGLHSKLLKNYQALKQKGSSMQLKVFVGKCHNIEMIMKDFKDTTLLTQSFLLINLIRSVISSLITAILFGYPLLQIILQFILNILMIVYLLTKKPFKEPFETYGQLFCEVVLLIANICVVILATFNHAESYPIDSIKRLSQYIIALYYILLLGCAVLLMISLGKILYKNYQEKKNIQSASKTLTVVTETTEKVLNQPEIDVHSDFAVIISAQGKGNDHIFENQVSTYRHSIQINCETQNARNNEDLSQSNILSRDVFHSKQCVQNGKKRGSDRNSPKKFCNRSG